jgi:hypothetical protein
MIFVAAMGDISYAKLPDVRLIMERIHLCPKTTFLFCTKNPAAYQSWGMIPDNVILGTTLETNRDTKKFSKAPSPEARVEALSHVHARKMVAIEPVMVFDLTAFLVLIDRVSPELIEIGGDNYDHDLPEPNSFMLAALIDELEKRYKVNRKDGLARLLKFKKETVK